VQPASVQRNDLLGRPSRKRISHVPAHQSETTKRKGGKRSERRLTRPPALRRCLGSGESRDLALHQPLHGSKKGLQGLVRGTRPRREADPCLPGADCGHPGVAAVRRDDRVHVLLHGGGDFVPEALVAGIGGSAALPCRADLEALGAVPFHEVDESALEGLCDLSVQDDVQLTELDSHGPRAVLLGGDAVPVGSVAAGHEGKGVRHLVSAGTDPERQGRGAVLSLDERAEPVLRPGGEFEPRGGSVSCLLAGGLFSVSRGSDPGDAG